MKPNTPEARRIGATIRALREAYGWQLGKFAVVVDMSHGHLANIEAGRKVPTAEKTRLIAEKLGVPLAALTTEYDVEEVA